MSNLDKLPSEVNTCVNIINIEMVNNVFVHVGTPTQFWMPSDGIQSVGDMQNFFLSGYLSSHYIIYTLYNIGCF